MRIIAFTLLFSLWTLNAVSQSDTLQVSDTLVQNFKFKKPNRAALHSAIIPGWGQLTNAQAWKIPIVYAGLGTTTYFIIWNHNQYKRFRNAYRIRSDNNPNTKDEFDNPIDIKKPNYSTEAVLRLREDYRRNRDLSIILTAGFYALNVLDAYISAHLKDFDVSDNLSMNIRPDVNTFNNQQIIFGVKLAFNCR